MAFVCGLIQIGLYITISESAGILPLEYKSVNQSSFYKINDGEKGVDNDTYTFALTKTGDNESWTVTFKQPRLISCFTIILRGGTYVILVKNYKPEISVLECSKFALADLARTYTHNRCCTHELTGTELMVVRQGYGSLRLYELTFKDCDGGQYGMNCLNCSDSCATCDAVTGSCTSCITSRYGEMRERECPHHCSKDSCIFCIEVESYIHIAVLLGSFILILGLASLCKSFVWPGFLQYIRFP